MRADAQSTNPNGALWHPFADMGAVAGAPFLLDRAEGCYVWDADGRRYLDATAALWYANLGHGRPEIAAAISAQLERLDSYSIFGDYANAPSEQLADRLAALAPMADAKVFLGSGGGDAIDTAAKVARAFFQQRGEAQRVHLISRRHGYHGTHGYGTSLAGIPGNATGWGPLLGDTSVVPHDDATALEAEILRVGADRVAAFFCEPVIGAGGVHLPPDGYIEEVAAICRRHGVLFVADCVISGFGRLGSWLGIDRWSVQPDMIALAKGVSNGTLPLGALIVSGDVAAPFFTGAPGAPVLRHGATYAGHPVCCAAALAALDLYEAEDVIPQGRRLEGDLASSLGVVAGHELVAEVRSGLGLLAGIDVRDEVLEAAPNAVVRLQQACREAGVLVRPLSRGVAVSPPLTVNRDELDAIGAGIRAGLDAVAAQLPIGSAV